MYLKALISLASRSPCSLVTGACLFCRLIERRGKIERKEPGTQRGGRRARAFQDCDKARVKGKRRRRPRSKQLAAIVIGLARPRLALDSFSLMDEFSLRSDCVPTRRIGALWYFRTSNAHFCLTFSNEVGLTTEGSQGFKIAPFLALYPFNLPEKHTRKTSVFG